MGAQISIDKRIDITIYNGIYITYFNVRSMIFYHRIWMENVGTYLTAPTDFFLLTTQLLQFLFFLFNLQLIQAGFQHFHCPFTVLNLRSFRLTRNDNVCRSEERRVG